LCCVVLCCVVLCCVVLCCVVLRLGVALFTLTYRRGLFPQSEECGSLLGAIARACIMLEAGGCSGFQVEQDGHLVMRHVQIIAECRKANSN